MTVSPRSSSESAVRLRVWLQRLWGAEGIALLIGLLQNVASARLLGLTDFGIAALILTAPTMVFVFLDPQSEESVVRFGSEALAQSANARAWDVVRLAYRIDAVLAVVGLVVISSAAYVGLEALGIPDADRPLVLVSAIGALSLSPAATARAWLVCTQEYSCIARCTWIASSARCVLAIIGAAVGGLPGYIVGVAAGNLAGTAAFASTAREVRLRRGITTVRKRLDLAGRRREILQFMAFTDLTTLASVFVKHADVLIVGSTAGAPAAGLYRFAQSISAPVAAVLRPLQTVSYPRLTVLAVSGAGHEFRREIARYVRTLSLPLLLFGGFAVALLPIIVPVVGGHEYAQAAAPAMILAGGSLLGLVGFWIRPAALALRLEKQLLVIGLSMTILTVAGYFFVADPYGPEGVAAVRVVIAVLIGNVLALVVLLRGIALLRSGDEVDDLGSKGVPSPMSHRCPDIS